MVCLLDLFDILHIGLCLLWIGALEGGFS
jgi:hypothetical protein